MMKKIAIILLLSLLPLVVADTFTFQGSGAAVDSQGNVTVDNWQIGYGAQQIAESSLDPGLIFVALIIVGFSLIYIAIEGEDV